MRSRSALPAAEGADRTTVGIHLVEGIPVADSAAGRDRFTPVPVSRVADLLTRGTSLRVSEVHVDVLAEGWAATASAMRALWDRPRWARGGASVLVLDAVTEGHLPSARRRPRCRDVSRTWRRAT